MDLIDRMLSLFFSSLMLTLQVFLELFGGIFIMGILLYFFARFTRNLFAQTFGQRTEVVLTAWIGTPVHEFGHAFFCLLFGHKIKKIKLFTPGAKDGSQGLVVHTYNSRNLYHRVGNFFIGTGPLISGSAAVFLLVWCLLPSSRSVFDHIHPEKFELVFDSGFFLVFIEKLWQQTLSLIPVIFSATNYSQWQFWLFMYLSLAVSAHMELSPPDLKQMWSGLWLILLLILAFNIVYLLFFSSYRNILFQGARAFAYFNQLLIFGLLFSMINFIITWIVSIFYGMIFLRKFPNPFVR